MDITCQHDFLRTNPNVFLKNVNALEAIGSLMTSSYKETEDADVLICCGSQEFYMSVAETASDIYHNGQVGTIIVSGKPVVEETGFSESESMQKILIENDVPSDIILIDNYATNSQENIHFSKAVFATYCPNRIVESVFAVGRKSSSYRFIATLVENWKDVDIRFRGAPDFDSVHPCAWHKTPDVSQYIWGEVNKILEYGQKGYLSSEFSSVVNDLCHRAIEQGGNLPEKIRYHLSPLKN